MAATGRGRSSRTIGHERRNVIQRCVDEFAEGLGMVKKSGSWYRHTDGVIAILNLQKSQYAAKLLREHCVLAHRIRFRTLSKRESGSCADSS